MKLVNHVQNVHLKSSALISLIIVGECKFYFSDTEEESPVVKRAHISPENSGKSAPKTAENSKQPTIKNFLQRKLEQEKRLKNQKTIEISDSDVICISD